MKLNLENRLRRVTSGGGYLPEVDRLRFIAIFTVLYYHMWHFFVAKNAIGVSRENTELISHFFDLGGQGVQLFFMISGFILGLPFAKQYTDESYRKINIKRYYLRRLERLEPTYIISLLLFLVIGLVSDTFINLFPHLVASILYLHNIVFLERSLINGVTWSLEIEVQFYLMAPFLAYYFKIKDIRFRRFLLTGFIVLWSFVTDSFRFPFVSLYDYIQYFLCGFLVVDFYLEGFHEHFFKNNAWLGGLLLNWLRVNKLV